MIENMLRAKIIEKGYNVDTFCAKAGFARSTFDRKLTGKTDFDRSEIEKIIEVLDLKDEELRNIFFPKYFAENCKK